MTDLEKAARQALEAMRDAAYDEEGYTLNPDLADAHDNLRRALEQQPAEEPVALQMDVIVVNLVREGINKHRARELAEHFIKHARPQPAAHWVGLTEQEWERLVELYGDDPDILIRETEAKLREKNGGAA